MTLLAAGRKAGCRKRQASNQEEIIMSYLNLIVKGDKFTAARAAADHNIPFVFVREVLGSETVGKTGPQHRDKVAKWFGEATTTEAPFPAGTLLLYGERDDNDSIVALLNSR
jgi:hypothetical protein